MSVHRAEFRDVQRAVAQLVGKNQLSKLEDGQVITFPKTNKQYKLCVDSQKHVVVQRASEFLNQKVSVFKRLSHSVSDLFGISTTKRLAKILNDDLVQGVLKRLESHEQAESEMRSDDNKLARDSEEDKSTDRQIYNKKVEVKPTGKTGYPNTLDRYDLDEQIAIAKVNKEVNEEIKENSSLTESQTQSDPENKPLFEKTTQVRFNDKPIIHVLEKGHKDVVIANTYSKPSPYTPEEARQDLNSVFIANNKGYKPRRLIMWG